MSPHPLNHLAPTPEPLLNLVRQNVDDDQLQEMARADYARDIEEHLKALRQIKNVAIPAPMEWYPREVLELTRWIEPDSYPPEAKSQKIKDHWLRLFACVAIAHADVNPKNDSAYHWGSDETTIQLVESVIHLGTKTSEAALQFLCWCLHQEQQYDNESWYFALAILSIATTLNKCNEATREYLLSVAHNYGSTLPTLIKQSQRKDKWIQLAEGLEISLQV